MSTDAIPRKLKRFLSDHIDSVTKLEVLILLHQHPERKWSITSVGAELRCSPTSIEDHLKHLTESKLLKSETTPEGNTYQFAPDSAEVKLTVSEMARYYSEYHTRVIEWLYTKPMENIQSFANAFKIRKDE